MRTTEAHRTTGPDPRLLTDDKTELQRLLTEQWVRVIAAGGDDELGLELCARLGAVGLTVDWPDLRWIEALVLIGGTAAATHWRRHRDRDLAEAVIPVIAKVVDTLGWAAGGPRNLLEARDAQNLLAAARELAATAA
jgi:hypothetical protein